MKISVVVPCHNAGQTIAQTLQSIAAQRFAPHEIIVVDDASTDDSLAQIARSGVAVTLVSSTARRASAARNAGIARASGDWIALLDADDVWFPNHLEQAQRLLPGGDDVAYMANHLFRSARGDAPIPDSLRHQITQSRGGLTGEEWLQLLVKHFHFGHSTVLYQRARLQQVGGFDESYERLEDLDLWLRMLDGHTWTYGAEVAMAYRTDTPNSLSKNMIKSEFFYLKTLLKNRAAYPFDEMQILIRRLARRATSLGFVDGTRAQFGAALKLSRPYLAPQWRVFYALAPLVQTPLRLVVRLRRRWVWRHCPENVLPG